MKRWYLSPIAGKGTKESPWRPIVSGVNVSALMPMDAQGKLLVTEAMVLIDCDNHEQLVKQAGPLGLKPLPDRAADEKLTAMSRQEQALFDEQLESKYPLGVDRQLSYRELVVEMCQRGDENFTADRLNEIGVR